MVVVILGVAIMEMLLSYDGIPFLSILAFSIAYDIVDWG